MDETIITLIGPTASGKTKLAVRVADRLDAEIISGDSRQVYRGMDIGTGKDVSEYMIGGKQIPFHLIDVVDAGYKYNVYEFQRDFQQAYRDITQREKQVLFCGGTGLYIESVLRGFRLDAVPVNPVLRAQLEKKSLPELVATLSSYKTLHNTTDVDTVKRAVRAIEIEAYYRTHPAEETSFPPLSYRIFGLWLDREERRKRISLRLKARLEEGLIEEVQGLLAQGVSLENLMYYGLEYKYVCLYLTGALNYNDFFGQLETAIHQFAKRQMTWFRGMEKRGLSIKWLDASASIEENVEQMLLVLNRGD